MGSLGAFVRLGMIIVITGPIASGKSTTAAALAAELDRAGRRAAVIDLDRVHDRLIAQGVTADDGSWTEARRRAAMEATALATDGVEAVIAEGSFNLPGDRTAFERSLAGGDRPVYVTLHVSFDEALRRARSDPARGRSRDAIFLRTHFEERREVLSNVPASDIVIDTERMTPTGAATTIVRHLASTPQQR